MHQSAKPVRKCNGCGLNLNDHCGVYANPRLMWQRHAVCPGHMNKQLLADYITSQARREGKPGKEQRRALARLRRQAVVHQDGDRHVILAARH